MPEYGGVGDAHFIRDGLRGDAGHALSGGKCNRCLDDFCLALFGWFAHGRCCEQVLELYAQRVSLAKCRFLPPADIPSERASETISGYACAMLKIGQFNSLKVTRSVDFGLYLDGGDEDDILLPKRYVPEGTSIDDSVDVFVYFDSEDRLIATTERPRIVVGACAFLKCVSVSQVGAFLDWGLTRDLMVPFAQQATRMVTGRHYVVIAYVDSTGRIAASSKLHHFLPEKLASGDEWLFTKWKAVNLLVCGKSEMGYKAVINGSHLGLIFRDEAFKPLKYGQQVPGFIKDIRSDGKIDLSLQLHGQAARDDISQRILFHLEQQGGSSDLTDKSSPDEIHRVFGVSKGNYKKALGKLYKQRLIDINKDKITLLKMN
jgi:predicted RNA-binding protein (virulence factor B family)